MGAQRTSESVVDSKSRNEGIQKLNESKEAGSNKYTLILANCIDGQRALTHTCMPQSQAKSSTIEVFGLSPVLVRLFVDCQ
jgi:hypothetical protein